MIVLGGITFLILMGLIIYGSHIIAEFLERQFNWDYAICLIATIIIIIVMSVSIGLQLVM
jgi:hypothetical protein